MTDRIRQYPMPYIPGGGTLADYRTRQEAQRAAKETQKQIEEENRPTEKNAAAKRWERKKSKSKKG